MLNKNAEDPEVGGNNPSRLSIELDQFDKEIVLNTIDSICKMIRKNNSRNSLESLELITKNESQLNEIYSRVGSKRSHGSESAYLAKAEEA